MNELRRNSVEERLYAWSNKENFYESNGRIGMWHGCVALFGGILYLYKKTADIMHEIKTCPRCNKPFECKSGSIAICQCAEVCVSPETREVLAGKYDDCLCKECLMIIENENTKTWQQ